METKMISVVFDVEIAKEIQAGKYPGKIMTRDGKDVRVVCWDAKNQYPIVALYESSEGQEDIEWYTKNGSCFCDGEIDDTDLILQIPEWSQFKDGDVIFCEAIKDDGSSYYWLSVLNGQIKYDEGMYFQEYVSWGLEGCENENELFFDNYVHKINSVRLASPVERGSFIDVLKLKYEHYGYQEIKECLKKYFDVTIQEVSHFEPFDKVLVRDSEYSKWTADFFSYINENNEYVCTSSATWTQCIPYNKETKRLIGTAYKYEE